MQLVRNGDEVVNASLVIDWLLDDPESSMGLWKISCWPIGADSSDPDKDRKDIYHEDSEKIARHVFDRLLQDLSCGVRLIDLEKICGELSEAP
jgi:hypothetical protein